MQCRQRQRPSALVNRRRGRHQKALLLAGLAGLMAGCRAPRIVDSANPAVLPTFLFMAVGISEDQPVTAELVEGMRQQLQELTQAFRKVHPSVSIQLQVYPDAALRRQLARRNLTGLGPDLLLVGGQTALELEREGMVRSVRFPAAVTEQLLPGPRMRMSLKDGQLAGLPMQLVPELACFNRARLRQPPADLDQLVARSATGLRVGLPTETSNLFWTAGSMGANQSLGRASRGERLTPAERQPIQAWLAWLQQASLQKEIGFYSAPEQLQELQAGRLDWITCRSTSIPRLRQVLGDRLGVSTLPAGPGGEPTPVTRELVWAFGVSSSPRQRRAAENLAVFTLQPLIQRSFTVRSMEVLPVNRRVAVPVASSAILTAMVDSLRQSLAADVINQEIRPGDRRLPQLERLLNRLVVGELDPSSAAAEMVQLLGRQR